jgi:hypothetical protein
MTSVPANSSPADAVSDEAGGGFDAATDAPFDADEENTNQLNPLVPRQIDLPTDLPHGGELDPEVGDIAKIFSAPSDPSDWPAWRADLAAWRVSARARLDYRGDAYDDPATRWASTAYSVAQIWLWDERLFDHATQRFTVDRFLDAVAPHGGFDGIVLWHAYPVIGIDDRNQFDFYRDVPGLAALITDFRARGIRTFVDYNPWDTGTRRTGRDDAEELSALVAELGADGVFLDTMKEGNSSLVRALRSTTPPQVLEGESRVPNARIEDHQLSWAQWFADSEAPGVMRAHWYERRHMMHGTRRWNRDHSDELQSAWMNGTGILVWDAVFGVWVGWNARDLATHRRMLRVQRAFSSHFIDGEWSPLDGASETAIAAGVYASRWSLGDTTLWTVVNRGHETWTGKGLVADVAPGARRFDLIAGLEVPAHGLFTVPARGVAAVLEIKDPVSESLSALLAEAAGDLEADSRPSDAFPSRTAVRVVPSASTASAPEDSIAVAGGEREFTLTFRRRETGWYQGAPYVEEWKPLPPRLHDQRRTTVRVELRSAAVATREVTGAEWAEYLTSVGRVPEAPAGEEPDAPATRITLGEAREYAAWKGARLPTEFEWQAAAEDPAFERSEPLVWNLTESEHSDGVTRFSMLKGGSAYRAEGSDWYVDGGRRDPEFSLKYLHLGLGLDASENVGFRLAWDISEPKR